MRKYIILIVLLTFPSSHYADEFSRLMQIQQNINEGNQRIQESLQSAGRAIIDYNSKKEAERERAAELDDERREREQAAEERREERARIRAEDAAQTAKREHQEALAKEAAELEKAKQTFRSLVPDLSVVVSDRLPSASTRAERAAPSGTRNEDTVHIVVPDGMSYADALGMGQQLLREGKAKQSLDIATQTAQKDTNRFEAFALAAVSSNALHATDGAKALIAQAIERAPEQKKPKLREIAAGFDNEMHPQAKVDATFVRKQAALQQILDEASHADASRKEELFEEFLTRSSEFLKRYPETLGVWASRAAVALEVNKAAVGSEAGLKLLALGLDKSKDPGAQMLLARLERKNWLRENADPSSSQK
jgi:hypothetical protein